MDSDTVDTLKGCFECTDWDIFTNSCDSTEELVDTVSGYINFCEQTVVTSKTVKCFPNNKPWVTKEIKDKLIQKRKFLQSHNRIELKIIQKELDKEIKNCKNVYKAKLERNFESGNSREAWRGLQAITGYKRKPNVTLSSDPRELCDNLNQFYARFDVDVPHENINHLKKTLPRDENFSIDHKDVVNLFAGLNVRKASGPDNISPLILKNCADQLAGVYKCNELGGNMARFTQFPIMITRSTIIYEIISPGAAGSSIYV